MSEQGTVPQAVARRIMREAVRRQLVPGERLAAEPVLMSFFEVSRGSLREALRVLAFLGAIEVRPGPSGGPRIAMPKPRVIGSALAMALQFRHATLRTLFEARAAMEPSIAALAAERRKDEDLAELNRCMQALRGSVGTEGFRRLNHQFHELVAEAGGNEALAMLISALTWMSTSVDWGYDLTTQARIVGEKTAILEAIRTRRAPLAKALTDAMFSGVLDDTEQSSPDHLSARVIWADIDELIYQDPSATAAGSTSRKDTTWTSR